MKKYDCFNAPRLNALGRLGDATPGVQLLTTFDDEAQSIADFMQSENEDVSQSSIKSRRGHPTYSRTNESTYTCVSPTRLA